MKLSQVLTTNIETKIKYIAELNQTILKRIGTNDLIEMEIKYHAPCFLSKWSKYKKPSNKPILFSAESTDDRAFQELVKDLNSGFAKYKGFSITAIKLKNISAIL